MTFGDYVLMQSLFYAAFGYRADTPIQLAVNGYRLGTLHYVEWDGEQVFRIVECVGVWVDTNQRVSSPRPWHGLGPEGALDAWAFAHSAPADYVLRMFREEQQRLWEETPQCPPGYSPWSVPYYPPPDTPEPVTEQAGLVGLLPDDPVLYCSRVGEDRVHVWPARVQSVHSEDQLLVTATAKVFDTRTGKAVGEDDHWIAPATPTSFRAAQLSGMYRLCRTTLHQITRDLAVAARCDDVSPEGLIEIVRALGEIARRTSTGELT